MRILKKIRDVQQFIAVQKQKKAIVGFVPTMGALHPGHISLLKESRASCDIMVCSIFVNPTQFNNKADLEKYPRTIENDIRLLTDAECDLLFLPEVEEIYPSGASPAPSYNLGKMETLFEGAFRPGHFQGVCQVVDRLFRIVAPHHVFFGQKDYQQCMVIRLLLQQVREFEPIQMHIVPTLREANGLAMSSRNLRLTAEQRITAAQIYTTLLYLKSNLSPGDVNNLIQTATLQLTANGFQPDYVAIADSDTLEPVLAWDGHTRLVALVAAFLGEVRLIDNMVLTN